MLEDYRRWLESELTLLGNASHHAYAFGQANMAKRALETFDELIAANVVLALTSDVASEVRADLAALESSGGTLPRGLSQLRDSLAAALVSKPQ